MVDECILDDISLSSACYDWGYTVAKQLGEIDLVENFIDKLKRGSKSNKHTSFMFDEAERGAEMALVDIINTVYLTPSQNAKPKKNLHFI